MSSSDLFSGGNEAFVDEDYELAIKHYTEAITIEATNYNYFTKRGLAYVKTERYEDAIDDFKKSIQLDGSKWNTHFKKGQAEFALGQFTEAKASFQSGLSVDGNAELLNMWIRKCDAEIDLAEVKLNAGTAQIAAGISSPPPPQSKPETAPTAHVEAQPTVTQPPPPKARYDWYQTDTHIILSILVKNAKTEDLTVDLSERNMSASVRLSGGSDYNLELDLAHPIIVSSSSTKILSSKIEVKLKKLEGIRWSSLETDNESAFASRPSTSTGAVSSDTRSETIVKRYPTSSRHYHDWDKVAADITKQEKEEKLDGEAGLNKLFQGIYSDGSEEVRRAMNKSFVESGGTVLSTNWKDIGKTTVECKPPDGMEFKKYEI